MKKLRNFIITFLLVFLFSSTFNFSTWKVHAQDNVTKVNHFYSADTVVSGTTTPNTRVKYVGKNNYGETYGVFSAVSNSDGIFKMYVGNHQANTTFTIYTYDSTGDLIDSDEVFVLKASLDAYFSIGFGNKMVEDQGEIGETPIKRPMPSVYYTASQDSKIEIMVNDKIIKTDKAGGGYRLLECPEIHLGDFVQIRVSKGNVIKTYELLATSYDIYDKFMYVYPISTSKVTSWSDSIRFYLPSNLKFSGLLTNTKNLLPSGVIKQSYDGNTTIFPLTLYDGEFENVIYNRSIKLSTSPKPDIEPVSQISKEVTGFATENSLITVLDEQNTKLGESLTNENGRFAVPVNKLEPDSIIKVETRIPNTDKYDYSYTSVEEVYVDDLSDNNDYITGQSSFGKEAEVFLLDSNSMIKSLSVNGATTKISKKSIGKFTLNKGSMFKLYIGKQKANSIIQVELRENGMSLSLPTKIVKDKTAPVISGVKNNGLYKADVIPLFNEGDAIIDGKIYVKGTKITKEGHHKFIVKDSVGNTTTIVFRIDKTAPVISGIKNNGLYKVNVIPVFHEGKATIDGKTYVKGTKITKEGHHKFIVKDNAGNSTTLLFTIDKTAPLTPTVNKIKSSSRSLSGKGEKGSEIYAYKGKVRFGHTSVNSKGTYSLKISKQRKGVILTVYAVDKAGNKSKSKNIKVG
ncbi:Ig-like domain-containing protein [Fictibacillus sp. B-59209]|uniref:Ig-like domain-containing protein n=1 Tax=Fictibacillus sp. B-59209 TaxID=3024873 RepID=UPI002E23E158|nr:Ig-like domain-containing protein [Fictibacillus sp. B-59209]